MTPTTNWSSARGYAVYVMCLYTLPCSADLPCYICYMLHILHHSVCAICLPCPVALPCHICYRLYILHHTVYDNYKLRLPCPAALPFYMCYILYILHHIVYATCCISCVISLGELGVPGCPWSLVLPCCLVLLYIFHVGSFKGENWTLYFWLQSLFSQGAPGALPCLAALPCYICYMLYILYHFVYAICCIS